MRRVMRAWGVMAKNEITARMSYRFDFVTGIVVSLLGEMLLPVITLVIYSTGAAFPGWSFDEALLIQSIFIMSKAVSSTFFFGMTHIVMEHVREGTFDLFLIKPVPVSLAAVGMSFSVDGICVFAGGLAMFVYSLSKIGGAAGWPQFILVFIMAVLVLLGFTFIMSATMFRWVGNSRIYEIFESLISFGRYPASIYSKAFSAVITYVIPAALLGTIPAEALLRPGGWGNTALASVFAAVFMGAGYLIWRVMLRSYSSAGG